MRAAAATRARVAHVRTCSFKTRHCICKMSPCEFILIWACSQGRSQACVELPQTGKFAVMIHCSAQGASSVCVLRLGDNPDSSAWEDVSVKLRPLSGDSRSTEAVDRAPFLDWLARRVDVLRRVQILTWKAPPGRGVRCNTSSSRATHSAMQSHIRLSLMSVELLARAHLRAEHRSMSVCTLRQSLIGS